MQTARLFIAQLATAACLALPVAAQETTLDTVVATVGGTDITVGHMIVARASLPQQYQELPDEVLFTGILDQLIQQTALQQTFSGEEPARLKLSLENERRSLIAGEVIETIMAEDVTEAELQAAYDEQYVNAASEQEFNASHILVETEEEAKAIVAELADGADFASTAQEKSTGPSGPNGGSLGWFGKGMMVPSFEAATLELKPGEVSVPVETQFGWHVILLNETRQTEAPSLESVKGELELQVRQTRVQARIEAVTSGAEVERSAADTVDPSVTKNIEWLE